MNVGWKLILWWMFATFAGLLAGLAIMFMGFGALINHFPILIFGFLFGGVLGATCGIAQWLVLKLYFRKIGWWVLATFLAWGLFWSLNMAGIWGEGSGIIGKILEGIEHGSLFGGLLGGAQWLILRQKISQSAWWILANIIGWGVSAAIGDGVKTALNSSSPIDLIIGIIGSTFITGIALMYLLKYLQKR